MKRLIAVLAVALAGGCALTAEQHLQGLPDKVFDEIDGGVSLPPDAYLPPGPAVARDHELALLGVAQPRGLAWDGTGFFTTDRADDRLVQLDANGAVLGDWALPERGVRALAWHDQRLYVAYSAVIYAFEGGEFTQVAEARSLRGMAATDEGLVTVQSSGLYVHRDGSLAPRYEISFSGEAGPLVRFGDRYLVYQESQMLDGAHYQAFCQLADAADTERASVDGVMPLPVDASEIAGLALADDTLWALGVGAGDDGGALVALRLTPEAE